ncbi:phosphatase 2C-like domain-containing protein [Truncatella angustata]|uniref:Phosphatase 2C-like domain-containing protein n=1 Tax=Truncatella angustata TaxID=152316 RepID=A0A9P8UKR8_9PEZI|nr:phosphatase 2C-like domain-containing protein [Truncatella angustata]KAH6653981.1 phosphatase 2C-like domain-containing protein [Truncatella angustata]KAH8194409.1 hypothetical protein TruAng_011428 [Truncatella angustata]
MMTQQLVRRAPRLVAVATTKIATSQARSFTSDTKLKGASNTLLVLGGLGSAFLAYEYAAGAGVAGQTKDVGANKVPDLNNLGPSDRIDYSPAITIEDVERRLNAGAFSCRDGNVRGVERYDGAELGSNAINEDASVHGKFESPLKTGDGSEWMAWGVFDGHNGWHTSKLLTKQLLPYVQQALRNIEPENGVISDAQIHEAIGSAFRNLDDALVKSAKVIIESDLPYSEKVEKLKPAQSGACALLTLYDPSSGKLHVANTGDCRAVIGYKTPDGKWKARALTKDQTGRNKDEIARLKAQFPDEPNIFLSKGRVYGMMPSRTFGDGLYKWDKELRGRLRDEYNDFRQPSDSRYPGFGDGPYLTASPVVNTIELPKSGHPCVLIQATDGLWDTMGNQNAIDLVSRWSDLQKSPQPEHETNTSVQSPEPVRFGNRAACWYSEARATYQDSNAAVHLIRNGLGGKHDEMVRGALSFTSPLSRWIRDDATVQVVFFGGRRGE